MTGVQTCALPIYARYAVVPRQQPGSLVFNDTRFHPAERLVFGGPQNPASAESFRGDNVNADRLTVVSAVDGLTGVEKGQTVAEVTLVGLDGDERRYGLRYGLELTTYRRGSPNPENALWAYYGPAFVPRGPSFGSQLSGTILPIDPPMRVTRIDVRFLADAGLLMVHGLGLRDAQTFATRSIVSNDRVKYQPVYEDLD